MANVPDIDDDVYYVKKSTIDSLAAKLDTGEEIIADHFGDLEATAALIDEEIMAPVIVDLSTFDDLADMVRQVGARCAAMQFVEGSKRATQALMTAKEFRETQVLQDVNPHMTQRASPYKRGQKVSAQMVLPAAPDERKYFAFSQHDVVRGRPKGLSCCALFLRKSCGEMV